MPRLAPNLSTMSRHLGPNPRPRAARTIRLPKSLTAGLLSSPYAHQLLRRRSRQHAILALQDPQLKGAGATKKQQYEGKNNRAKPPLV